MAAEWQAGVNMSSVLARGLVEKMETINRSATLFPVNVRAACRGFAAGRKMGAKNKNRQSDER
jgi:hypothetical protein